MKTVRSLLQSASPPGDSPTRVTMVTKGPQPWGFRVCTHELRSPRVPPERRGPRCLWFRL